MSNKTTKFCPKCLSTNINFGSLSLGNAGIRNGSFDEHCENCGHGNQNYNTIFPEIKISDLEKLKKEKNNSYNSAE